MTPPIAWLLSYYNEEKYPLYLPSVRLQRGPKQEPPQDCPEGDCQTINLGLYKRISHPHLELKKNGDEWLLTDRSTNGTYVNFVRVAKDSPLRIKEGDLISVLKPQNEDAAATSTEQLFSRFYFTLDPSHFKKDTASPDGSHLSQQAALADSASSCTVRKSDDAPSQQDSVPQIHPATPQTSAVPPATAPSQTIDIPPLKRSTTAIKLQKELECPICGFIMYNCVSVLPCLHSVCSYCLSRWMEQGKTNCPSCRGKIASIVRNHKLRTLIDDYLQDHPEEKRSEDELSELTDGYVLTEDNLRKLEQSKHQKKTLRSLFSSFDDEEEETGSAGDDDDDDSDTDSSSSDHGGPFSLGRIHPPPFFPFNIQRCKQCAAPGSDGFQCPPNGKHLLCSVCYQYFPDRHPADGNKKDAIQTDSKDKDDDELKEKDKGTDENKQGNKGKPEDQAGEEQKKKEESAKDEEKKKEEEARNPATAPVTCAFCGQHFCNLYWGCAGPNGDQSFRLLKDHEFTTLPDRVLLKNDVETRILRRLITEQRRLTIREAFADMFHKLGRGEAWEDTRDTITGIPLEPTTPICRNCLTTRLPDLVLRYRKEFTPAEIPPELAQRPNCYYGVNCRTQSHNPGHAQKYNHICKQTK